MSKKPKQSRHRIPACALEPKSDAISERYWAEVDASTTRLEHRYRKAQKALAAAEKRATKAHHNAASTKDPAAQQHAHRLQLLVEERRRELREIELLMMPTDYNGRDHKRRHVRQEAGAITIPLGATTGQHPKQAPTPVFPVTRERTPK